MMVGDGNMWINVGRSQFHLPTGNPQVLRGHTGIVIAGRAALLDRLAAVRERLAETRFSFSERDDHVEATCPWGNRMRCYEPDPARFGPVNLGIPYVEFDVPWARWTLSLTSIAGSSTCRPGPSATGRTAPWRASWSAMTSISCSVRPPARCPSSIITMCRSTS